MVLGRPFLAEDGVASASDSQGKFRALAGCLVDHQQRPCIPATELLVRVQQLDA